MVALYFHEVLQPPAQFAFAARHVWFDGGESAGGIACIRWGNAKALPEGPAEGTLVGESPSLRDLGNASLGHLRI